SAQANPYRVGLFVIGAVALVIAGLVGFGSGDYFKDRRTFVAYFSGSVAGLQVGAPVTFRGVPIGQVTRIVARYDLDTLEAEVPVFFEIAEGSIDTGDRLDRSDIPGEVQRLVDNGLRAQLVPQSFVTGQLYVQLGVHTGTEIVLKDNGRSGDDVIEVPAIPTTIAVLEQQLKSLLGSDGDGGLGTMITRIDKLVSDENARSFSNILKNVENFTEALVTYENDIDAILSGARDTVQELDTGLAGLPDLVTEAREAVAGAGAVMDQLGDPEKGVLSVTLPLRDAAASIGRMADQINNAVAENRDGLRNFTDGTLSAVDDLVLDLERLAQTLNRAAEQLERDPPGFLFGRGEREGLQ
ncbi:MAG: MlaD family protein, partial [Woeseiaceae bacterium]|nr:MlaD family protein [Woeseiaceae bacterium]